VALRHKLRASNAVARVAAAEVVEELKKKTSSTPLGAEASEPGTRIEETSSASPSSHATPTALDAKEEKREEGKRGEEKEKEKKRTTVAPPAPTPVRASPRRAAHKNEKAEEAAAPAAPPPAPIAGLSPVAGVVSGRSPVRSSPRLRAAALAAASNAPEPNERSAEDGDFRFAAHPARGSARRAPARGATTKTPSRLGNAFFSAEEDSAAKRERDEARRSATPASTERRLPSGDAETDAPSPRRNEPETNRDEPATNRKRAEAVPEPERVETLGRKSPRRGLTRGGARRVLISDSGAGAEARDVPGLPTPGSDAAARVPSPLLLGARSTGKSSVKSSGEIRLDLERVRSEETEQTQGAEEGIAAEGIAADGGAHSAAGRSVRTRSASRRAARPPPPKDLTVPVSPAITRASKRSRAGAFPSEKTSEELDLERSLAAAAAEKAKRQRRAAPAEGSGAVFCLGARSTRARGDARGEKSRVGSKTRAVSVAFGGRVRAGDTKETKRVAPPDEAAPRGARPVTVPRSPHLSGAQKRDRFFSANLPKTSEELELEKIAAVPKFRARPLTRSVLQGQDGAAEKAAAAAKKKREAAALVAKGKAKPAPFDATVGRARTRDERDAERAECAARDAKRARLASEAEAFGFAGAVPPTAPESPAFATARRAALRAPFLESDGGGSGVFARTTTTRGARRVAASDVDGPSAFGTDSLASDRFGRVDGVTCPAPFALATDRRGEAAKAELEFRLEQRARLEAERARAAAKARPVPKTSSRACRGRLPEPVFKPPTSTEPFRLRGEALSAYEKKRERERLEKEKEEEEKRRRFAAKPLPGATFRTVFAVRRSDKPLTTPAEDVLAAGARRAAERAAFDAEVAELAKQREEEQTETRRLEAEAEAKARKALRKSTRFVAAPMPDYDALASVGVAPVAERALTRPQSPPLRTNRRASRWG
jgi:hypothetical protein